MKSEYFRPAKKSITEHQKISPQPMSESCVFQDNLTDPGHPYSVPMHSAKFEALVNQVGGINQGPFKLDQKYVTRLYSSGSNLNLQTPSEGKPALSDFLHVKTVAFSNQDAIKKTKSIPAKQPRQEEKTTKPLLKTKQKLPSLYDQETTKENRDGTKRPNSVDLKIAKDNEPNNASMNQGVPKAAGNKEQKSKDSSLDVKSRQSRSMSQRRSESEGPGKGKGERNQVENSSNKTDRRYASTTPRKDSTNVSSKQGEAAGSGRFGPLQKIKEIKMKKTEKVNNLKAGNSQGKSTQSTNNTISTNGLSNRNKPTPSNNLSVESRNDSKSFLANKTNIHNNNANTSAVTPSPQAKLLNGSHVINSFKNAVSVGDKDSNGSALGKVINALEVYGSAKKNQNVPQQNRNARAPNQGGNHGQGNGNGNGATSNVTLPPINNNQPHNSNGVGLMTNGSALNLRPAYPSLRVEDVPKKKIVYVPPPQSNKYKFFVGGGNNSDLVKRVLAKRDWWEATEFFNTLFNLKWQQSYRGYRYDRLPDKLGAKQLVNHFEYHPEISTKNNLIKNLSTYCDSNKINLFDCTPLTFCFDMDDTANFDKDMQQFAKFFITHNPDPRKYPAPSDKKNQVWYSFDYRKKGAYQHPTSHHDHKVSPFLKPTMHDTFLKTANAWVLKPVGLNRGRGIEVFNTLETLNEFMNECFNPSPKKKAKKDDGSGSGSDDDEEEQFLKELAVKSRTFVIQKYIEDPLLINKRKFDIRVWVLITHEMQLYFFKEGYLRTSSQEFSLTGDEVSNKFIHLTNNAVQKHSTEYGQHEKGNQLSFKDFEEYMKANGLNGDFQGKILPRMKELVKISMQSVGKQLNQNDRKYCFEVFGYDFMIDNEFNVWLIEVNTNPCLDESSPLLHMLIPRMVDDAFKLTVDVIFPKVVKRPNIQQSKPAVSSDKKVTGAPQGALNLNLKSVQKEEGGDKTGTIETPKPKEAEVEVKEESGEKTEKNEEERAGSDEKFHEANATNVKEMMGEGKVVEEKKEVAPVAVVENKGESAAKAQATPIKLEEPSNANTNPNEVVFSVDGYSDSENMWEYICALSIPKSPMKRDLKAR